MITFLVSLVVAFGGTHIHVDRCHHGSWCRGTTDAYMPKTGPSSCKFKAWPPYFQPVIVYGCRRITKTQMLRRQYGDAKRSWISEAPRGPVASSPPGSGWSL